MPITNTYPPIGRKGYYSFETVDLGGTRYTWKPNQDRWEISGGSSFGDITGGRVPGINDRERLPSGEFAGGTYNNTTKGSTIPISDNKAVIEFTDFVFIVKSNTGANLFVNGAQNGQSPKTLRYSKSDILVGGDKRITVKKDGYTSNIEYVISNEFVAGNSTPNPYSGGYSTGIFGGSQRTLGMSTSTVVVKKYVNGQIVSYNGQNGNLFNLDFDLKEVPKKVPVQPIDITPIEADPTLSISISGYANGVVLLKNNKDEIRLDKGVNVIKDKKGSKFSFRAKGRYRISSLSTSDPKGGKYNVLGGRPSELTPNALITLDSDINVFVSVEPVVSPIAPPPPPLPPIVPPTPPPPVPEIIPLPPSISEQEREERRNISTPIIPDGPEPKIVLLENKTRTYDIKDKSGFPIAFRKNEEVEAVTVFVGTKHYVFDGLAPGPVGGVVVPASAFQQLGRLEVKIIPYDLDELDDTLELITRTAITRTKEITEERIIEVRRPVPTPIEIEERYEEPPKPVISDPVPVPLPPKPQPKDPIRIPPTRPPKVEQPKPRVLPTPQPVRVVPIPPNPPRGGGGGAGYGGEDPIDRRTNRPRPGETDFIEDDRIRRTERLL